MLSKFVLYPSCVNVVLHTSVNVVNASSGQVILYVYTYNKVSAHAILVCVLVSIILDLCTVVLCEHYTC